MQPDSCSTVMERRNVKYYRLVSDEWNLVLVNGNGSLATGWINVGGTWYYMGENGAMKTGWYQVKGVWYYSNGSGAMQTGWLNRGGTWYYLTGSGAMATGWINLGGTWYYLNPGNGDMWVPAGI